MRYLELLSPAKNLECGIAAIDHGADAVYIGAERFGARAAAGNSLEDIARLCDYAHVFGAKVYVTVNTIIYDNEIADTVRLVHGLYEAGADAILVQDMGLLEADLPPIALQASTQTDNRTAEKTEWLAAHGFSRVVLARELSVDEISAIHDAVPGVELETFVHGALCVSYSGLCYASQYCFKRSANRGECAQFCRLKFDLEDADGRVIVKDRHLLSLKDMCRIDHLEEMAHAGVTSFKIEGRLKDINYVKNVTAAYSMKLDEIIRRNPDKYRRASFGKCRYAFTPNLDKTFNRGYTDYFLTSGRSNDITSFDTPKAKGEYVGKVKEIRGAAFTVAGTAAFANGDGLCFINDKRELEGFRVNKAEANRIFPLKMPKALRPGMPLYRNNDQAFEKLLARKSAERKIGLTLTLEETEGGFAITATAEDGTRAAVEMTTDKQTAIKPQRDNVIRQLGKFGNTPFECADITLIPENFNYFIPSSMLAEARRKAVDELIGIMKKPRRDSLAEAAHAAADRSGTPDARTWKTKDENLNISNKLARSFYDKEGCDGEPDAPELKMTEKQLLMQCRHCLRYSLGHCTKRGGSKPSWREPLHLRLTDGRRFRLQFDCNECKMNIYAET